MSAEVTRRLCGIVVVSGLSIVGCSELIDPQQEDALEYRFPSEGEFVALDGPGTCMDGKCNIEFDAVNVRHTCVCHLPGIGTGPQGPPPPWPIVWPAAPGVYWRDWSGGGSWRSGGSGDTCDPTQIDPPCFNFEATLSCPVGVVRGSTGECRIDAGGRAFTVSKWHFNGAHVSNVWSANSPTWEGTLIESGDVRADILVAGVPIVVKSRITVKPRTSGKWSSSTPWQGKINFVKGEGPDCGGKRPAAYTVGLVGLFGWFSSWGNSSCGYEAKDRIRIDPSGEDGYSVKKATSGPNANLWYVEDAQWYFKGTSQLNKGVFSNAPEYTLWTKTQAQSCKSKGRGEKSNFWEFNSYCRPQPGFDQFIQALWNHEYEHYHQGRNSLRATENRLYVKVEGLIHKQQDQVIGPLTNLHKRTQDRLITASAKEDIIGNWSGTIWVWHNQADNHMKKLTLLF